MIIRINNIECREIKNSKDLELIRYTINPYYGKEENMKKDGWIFDSCGNAHKDCSTITTSCFKNEYTICTIGYIKFNRAGDEFDVHSVGCRLFVLNHKDEEDLRDILTVIEKQLQGSKNA